MATLTIRKHPKYGQDVYISIEKGQLLDSDYHGTVKVRFDNGKVTSFRSSRPDDGSSNTLFLKGAFSAFTSQLQKAKELKIEVPVYQAGDQVLTFNVSGFKGVK